MVLHCPVRESDVFQRISLIFIENHMGYATILLVGKETEIRYFQWFLLTFINKIQEIMKCLSHVIPNLT